MENAISYLNANPIFWVILGILAVLLILAIVKKSFKLLIVIAVIAVVYAGYLFVTGKEIPMNKEGWIEHGKELLEKGKDAGKDLLEKGKDAGEDLIEKGKKELQKKTTD